MDNGPTAIRDENGFYYGIADGIFKCVLFSKENQDLTKWFLSCLIGIPIYNYIIKNVELPKERKSGLDHRVDVIVEINDSILCNIEVNSSYYKKLHIRNKLYADKIFNKLYDTKEENDKTFIHIDITKGLKTYGYREVKNRLDLATSYGLKYLRNFVFFEIDVDKALEAWYNRSEEIDKYAYIIMLSIGESELKELVNGGYLSPENQKYVSSFMEGVVKVVRRFGRNCRARDRLA